MYYVDGVHQDEPAIIFENMRWINGFINYVQSIFK